MTNSPERCPCCGRPFARFDDYPRVRVLYFERLPLPEAIDDMSAAAAEKSLSWCREHPEDNDWSRRRINMTPEIERACQIVEVRDYLDRLANFVGQELEPSELLPPCSADRRFKEAHPVAGTPIFLNLTEGDATPEGKRVVEVQMLSRGLNLGSAAGPTLVQLGPIGRLTYEGILTPVDSTS